MIYIIKEEGLYQHKVNSSLVFTSNCKMGYLCHSEVFDWLAERRHITKHKPESGVASEEQT